MADDLQAKAYGTALSILSAGGLTTSEDILRTVQAVTDLLSPHHPDEKVDGAQLVRELEATLSIFQEDSSALVDDSGHQAWLDRRRDEIEWRFAERYLRYLRERENRPPAVLDRLDRITMKILSHLEDPERQGDWDRRGLVVGQVQSGKTANYIGLICRAVDSGYKLIVVLAGMYNNLRSQTQLRLDEGFLGFDTQKRQRSDGDPSPEAFAAGALGVGRLLGSPRSLPVASLTTSHDDGDFRAQRARAVMVPPGSIPILLVVKKHTSILNKLTDWVLDAAGRGDPKLVRDFSLLVIDDEADNASISTTNPFVDGRYSPEDVDPTKVNGAIRSLLNAFERKAYIGYTATPNASIFIPHDVDHPKYGRDLFPEHFIEYVPPPTNYFGPARLFGADEDGDASQLVTAVNDYASWLPDKHRLSDRPGPLPVSVKEAIRTFVLARAIRLARGQTTAHNSMLIHVTRWQLVQEIVRDQVREELEDLRGRIRFGDGAGTSILEELRDLYHREFLTPTNGGPLLDGPPQLLWPQVSAHLRMAVEPIEVRVINGYAKEALEYFERKAEGFNVIAIGGDKLSRGLTLEGLTVSYFLRAASTHDTLLQMGRWFGYRDGYGDTCRLYTTPRLLEAFRGVTEANQELISDFLDMADKGKYPRQYGLKIQDSVAGLLVTARNKMRTATRRRIGFSGEGPSTVVMHCDRRSAGANLSVVSDFARRLEASSPHEKTATGLIWGDVPGREVADHFFDRYKSPAAAWKVQGDAIAEYVRDRLAADQLTDWTVMIASSTDENASPGKVAGWNVRLFRRKVLVGLEDRVNEGFYSVKQLLSPGHEATDLSREERRMALEITKREWEAAPGRRKAEPKTAVGWAIRKVRPARRGLLVIYPLVPPRPNPNLPQTVTLATQPVVGFLASFPVSPGAPTILYQVNRVYNELFGQDDWDEELEEENV